MVQGDASWNCVTWVQNALAALEADGEGGAMGTAKLEWQGVRDTCMRYTQEKREVRRFELDGGYDTSRSSTWDMVDEKELIV